MDAFILGKVPALVNHEPIYESAWRERCRLVTRDCGKVIMDVFVSTRFMGAQGVDVQGR
jgi:hypothetical protein